MKMKLIEQGFILVAVVTLISGQGDFCFSPSGLEGRCAFINDCASLKSLIHGSSLGYRIVKQSACGIVGNKPMVCCPIDTNTGKTPENTLVTSSGTFYNSSITTTVITTTITTAVDTTTTGSVTTVTTTATSSTTSANSNPTASDGKCITLDGSFGICVKLKTCRNLAEKLINPTDENLEYVEKSRCMGSTPYSVCCEENQYKDESVTKTSSNYSYYKCSPSSVLPDPKKGCCGRESTAEYKTSEGQASIYQYPWMAILQYAIRPYSCVGSLISSQHVLTAAQCLHNPITHLPRNVSSVILGEYNTNNNGPDCVELGEGLRACTLGTISISVSSIFVHPYYNKENMVSYANDIGLIKLSEMAPYNEFIRPICLPKLDITSRPPENLKFFIAGWGDVDDNYKNSHIKLHIDLPFYEDKRCRGVYVENGHTKIWDKQICAGGELNVGSCRGDAGGPLMYFDGKKFEIAGITSFGFVKCGVEDKPDVYTKIYSYLDWIESVIKL